MAGVGHAPRASRSVPMAVAMRCAAARELLVARAGDEQHGHRERRQAVPQRLLRARCRRAAGSRRARRRCSRGGLVVVTGRGRQRREQRLGEPASRNASRPSASSDCASASSRSTRAARSCGVLDAGRAADEHEPLDQRRGGRARRGGRCGRPSSSRRRCPPDAVGEQVGGLPEVGSDVDAVPWPGASTATTSWSWPSAAAIEPQHFRFWVKPWTSTRGATRAG